MRYFLYALFITAFSIQSLSAQFNEMIYYSEDFGNGLNGWTTTSNSVATAVGQTAEWIYEADATSNGAFSQIAINSPTASNGAILFDADYMTTLGVAANLPPAPYPINDGEIISPIIDLLEVTSEVSIRFYQSFRGFDVRNSYFSYSIDNGMTWSNEINLSEESVIQEILGDTSENKIIINLPNAAGNPQVRLKFRGEMNFYCWMLDDIAIIEQPKHSMTIADDFYAVASSYSMPSHQIDTIRFLANIANIGSHAQNNVKLNVSVINSLNDTVFTTNNFYGNINPNDTIKNQVFNDYFIPTPAIEKYQVIYTIFSDSSISYPTAYNINASYTFNFEVTNLKFSKGSYEKKITAFTPDSTNSWTFGTSFFNYNEFTINNGDFIKYYGSKVQFSVSNIDDLIGQTVDVFLEEFNDSNNDGLIESNERNIAAFGIHTFTNNDEDNVPIEVYLNDFIGTTVLYAMKSNTNYLVSVRYNATSSTDRFYPDFNYDINYAAADSAASINGVKRIGSFFDFGNTSTYNYRTNILGNPTPLISLHLETLISTKTSLLANNSMEINPNPAENIITTEINLKNNSKNITIEIYNTLGQILQSNNYSNIKTEQLQFDLSTYKNGTYFIKLTTDEGYSVKSFIINK